MNILNTLSIKAYLAVIDLLPFQITTPTTVPVGAGSGDKEQIRQKVTETDLWQKIVVPVSIALGVLVVIAGIYKAITQRLSAKATGMLKTVAGTVLLAALLFNVGLLFDLIGVAGRVITSAVSSLGQLIGS